MCCLFACLRLTMIKYFGFLAVREEFYQMHKSSDQLRAFFYLSIFDWGKNMKMCTTKTIKFLVDSLNHV